MKKDRCLNGLDVFFSAAFLLTTGTIAAVILLTYDLWALRAVSNGLLPNLVLTIGAAAFVCAAIYKRPKRLYEGSAPHLRTMLLMSVAVLGVQALVCSRIYRGQLHDAQVVLNAAYCNVMGYPQYRDTAYFDTYPNNLFLLALETIVLSIPKLLLGMEPGMERCTLLLVLMQCVINTASGLAAMLLTRRAAQYAGLSEREAGRAGVFAWVVWLILIGSSAWLTVVYSDSMTVLMPVLLILLYAYRGEGMRAAAVYALIGLIGGVAFRMKPQSSLALIAVLIVDGASMLARRVRLRIAVPRAAIMLLMAALVIGPGMRAAERISDMELEDEKAFGVAHYLNMGLNTQTHGIFSPGDLTVSLAAPTRAERTQINLESAKNRLEDMGGQGLLVHLWDKAMINFADGSFQLDDFASSAREGTDGISALLQDIFHHDGAYRGIHHTVQQGAWVLVLMLCPFAVLAYRAARRFGQAHEADVLCVMMLTVTGVMLFNMLFEARGRYIFSNAPVMIALAATALCTLAQRTREKQINPM